MALPNFITESGAVCFESGAAIDCDGCYRAYHENINGIKGLDFLSDAQDGDKWVGVLTDSSGNPIVQGPNDPAPGYLIATTSLQDHTKNITHPLLL